MSKDRARPFSRKHRRYWIPVTGGMVVIGLIDIALGFCSYERPSDVHERIIYDVPSVPGAPGSGGPGGASAVPAPHAATGCAPAIVARVEAELPGALITACTPDRISVQRGPHLVELDLAGDRIVAVAEVLTLPEIPAAVMRAFAVAYPKTIPSHAVKHTRRGAEPTYELSFPPGAPYLAATLRADGTIIQLR